MTPKRHREAPTLADDLSSPVAPDDTADVAISREAHGPDLPNIPLLDDSLSYAAEVKPKWLRIGGYWYPRGGIPIDVFWQSGPVPDDLWVPDQGVQSYRGRG